MPGTDGTHWDAEGLPALQTIDEGSVEMPNYQMIDVREAPYLYTERTCSTDPADISRNMGIAFGTVGALLGRKGITSAGRPLSVYYTHDPETMTFRAGFLVSEEDAAKAEGEVGAGILPAGTVLNFIHRGPYAKLRVSYGEMMEYLAANEMTVGAPTWEIYLNDPDGVSSEDELETDCYVTVSARPRSE